MWRCYICCGVVLNSPCNNYHINIYTYIYIYICHSFVYRSVYVWPIVKQPYKLLSVSQKWPDCPENMPANCVTHTRSECVWEGETDTSLVVIITAVLQGGNNMGIVSTAEGARYPGMCVRRVTKRRRKQCECSYDYSVYYMTGIIISSIGYDA